MSRKHPRLNGALWGLLLHRAEHSRAWSDSGQLHERVDMSKFTAWITKYALTTGVLRKQVESDGVGLAVDRSNRLTGYYHGEGRQWHRTRDGAIAKAKELRDAKIKALRKQIAKLEAMTFEDAP